MGARLVATVLARWTHVNDRAFRALIRMAHTALDERNGRTPAGVYFGGHDLLALTFRNERGGNDATIERTVRRAIADLVKEGAIERVGQARSGSHQTYRLTLESARRIDQLPLDAPLGRQVEEDTGGPTEEDTQCPAEEDTSGPAEQDTRSPAIEEPLEEPHRSYGRREGVDLRTDLAVTRARAPDDKPQDPSRCTRHPAMPAGRCAPCRAQAHIQSPLLRVLNGGAA